MLGWAIALPIVGTYIITSVVLLNFPWLVHKKKKLKFRCRHISHRGGAAENLENTMTAYHHALNKGTEMLELDVRLTADKQVVVCHDDDLSRVTDTEYSISDFNYKDLPRLSRTLNVQFQPGVTCDAKNDDCHIPLLESVFEAFPNIPINVDIKTNSDVLIDKTHELICKYNRRDLTVWGNFSKEVTDKCYKKDPGIPIMFSMKRCAVLVLLFYTGLLPFIPIKESFLEIMLPVTMIRRFEVPRTMKVLCHIVDWFLISPILFKHLDKRGIQVTWSHNPYLQYFSLQSIALKKPLLKKPLFCDLTKPSLTYTLLRLPTYLWVLNDDSEFDFAFNKLKVAGVMTDYPTRLQNYLNGSNVPGEPVNPSTRNERSELIKKE